VFDPFQHNLPQLKVQDLDLQAIFQFIKTGNWQLHLSKQKIRTLATLVLKVFFDKNKLAWIKLDDFQYPRMALWLPEVYRKEALCETHDSIFASHNAAEKSYIKLTTSYFWPNVYSYVMHHTKTCLRCQQRKIPEMKIHLCLLCPFQTNQKFAFTLTYLVQWWMPKENQHTFYALLTHLQSMLLSSPSPTRMLKLSQKLFSKKWFCKLGISMQLHTDGGKEFVNKLMVELCKLLNCSNILRHHHTTFNAMPRFFNKTVKKYLASYVDETTLNWDEFLPALMLAYNTSYHSTIATTPFELLFGVKPRLPSLPAPEIEQHHYGESFAAEGLQLLQHARKLVHQTAEQQGEKYKHQFNQKAAPHNFTVGPKVWLSNTTAIGKNKKLTLNWIGPFVIVDVNDNNSKLQLKNNKFKIVPNPPSVFLKMITFF
jgi:hypothetical protein